MKQLRNVSMFLVFVVSTAPFLVCASTIVPPGTILTSPWTSQGSPYIVHWDIDTIDIPVEILAEGGGYFLETAKPIPEETPVENAIAAIEELVRAMHYEFG